MTETDIPDETLLAYADGMLDDEAARQVARAAARDPAVTERIALFRGTGDALAELARARRAEPVPAALEARVRETLRRSREEATVVPFARRERAAPWQGRPAAIAAGIALAVGIGAGWTIASVGSAGDPSGIALAAGHGVADALSEVASGATTRIGAGELTVVSSFRDGAGAFCREYEVEGGGSAVVAIACRDGAVWTPRFAAATGAQADGYAPASSLEAVDAFLTGIGAGAPLDAGAEAGALATTGH